MTVRDLLQEALEELGVQAPGQSMPPSRARTALARYNRWLDAQNAEPSKTVYADQWLAYTTTPSLSPHTFGPTGGGATWTVSTRPDRILAARRYLGSTPDVNQPITIRERDWWNRQRVPTLSSDVPTDLYPDYTWPNAALYFWPVPASALTVELLTRIVFAQVDYDTPFSQPAGYRLAHVLSLAEECAEAFGLEVSATLERRAGQARAVIYGANRQIPRIASRDAGMPRGSRGRTFNYLTRSGT